MSFHLQSGAALQLFDARASSAAFKVERLRDFAEFRQPRRYNYFTILWVEAGEGTFQADLYEAPFQSPVLLFFTPYQIIQLESQSPTQGFILQFHANFLCIETEHHEVGCNGVLFNDTYGHPQVPLTEAVAAELRSLVEQMEGEMRERGVAQGEALRSLLKMFLIKATRLKLAQRTGADETAPSPRLPVIEALTALIEQHFKTKHAPGDYAAALHITPKALGRLVKAHLGRTLTDLIRERWLRHAKWHLLHTRRTVKEIAWEVGFADELYFSRLFKQATGLAPTAFREFETAIRGGRNLSM